MAEVKSYKVKTLPSNPTPNSIYWVKASLNSEVSGYITDLQGVPYPLKDLNGIVGLTNTDGNLVITGTNNKVINLSTSLLTAINSALQSGDNISELVNDAGYITLADIPTFNPQDYDLEDFTNNGIDPFVKQSELSDGVTNLSYTPSPTNGVINSDTGTDATIPLADLTNAGLLSSAEKSKIETAIQPSDLSLVATSNDYNDLNNIPTEFTPSVHTHVEADITDLDKYTQQEVDDNFLSSNLSTYPTATTPIADTDQLFVIQGGVVKKVDKSEIGGTGGLVFFKSFLNVSPTAVTTNGVHTYVFSIPIPAETIKPGDVVEIRYSVAKISGSSSVNPYAWLSNSAGAMTQAIQIGILAGSPGNSKNLFKRSLIFESNTRFFSVISSAESNFSDEVQTAAARAFTDMSVNLTNDLYLDFSVKNNGAGNYVLIDYAYIKVFRNT